MDLEDKRLSPTTIKIYLTLLKVIINYAKKHNMVKYEIDPFEFCLIRHPLILLKTRPY